MDWEIRELAQKNRRAEARHYIQNEGKSVEF